MNKRLFLARVMDGLRPEDEAIIVLDRGNRGNRGNRDTHRGHFAFEYSRPYCKIIEINDGTEAASFCKVLDVIDQLGKNHEDIYIVEDDYDHKAGWRDVLQEGININPNGFTTLYDHPDKYSDYDALFSQIFVTRSCHWRTTPSTTNTYAFKREALFKNIDVHYQFSTGVDITRDHAKFLKLAELGQVVVSSIPGYSSHCDIGMISPLYRND